MFNFSPQQLAQIQQVAQQYQQVDPQVQAVTPAPIPTNIDMLASPTATKQQSGNQYSSSDIFNGGLGSWLMDPNASVGVRDFNDSAAIGMNNDILAGQGGYTAPVDNADRLFEWYNGMDDKTLSGLGYRDQVMYHWLKGREMKGDAGRKYFNDKQRDISKAFGLDQKIDVGDGKLDNYHGWQDATDNPWEDAVNNSAKIGGWYDLDGDMGKAGRISQVATPLIAAGLMFVPGLQGAGLALAQAANAGLGSGLQGGSTSDVLKSAGLAGLTSYAASQVPGMLEGTPLGGIENEFLKNAVQGSVTGGLTSAINGNDILQGALTGGVTGLAGTAIKKMMEGVPLLPEEQVALQEYNMQDIRDKYITQSFADGTAGVPDISFSDNFVDNQAILDAQLPEYDLGAIQDQYINTGPQVLEGYDIGGIQDKYILNDGQGVSVNGNSVGNTLGDMRQYATENGMQVGTYRMNDGTMGGVLIPTSGTYAVQDNPFGSGQVVIDNQGRVLNVDSKQAEVYQKIANGEEFDFVVKADFGEAKFTGTYEEAVDYFNGNAQVDAQLGLTPSSSSKWMEGNFDTGTLTEAPTVIEDTFKPPQEAQPQEVTPEPLDKIVETNVENLDVQPDEVASADQAEQVDNVSPSSNQGSAGSEGGNQPSVNQGVTDTVANVFGVDPTGDGIIMPDGSSVSSGELSDAVDTALGGLDGDAVQKVMDGLEGINAQLEGTGQNIGDLLEAVAGVGGVLSTGTIGDAIDGLIEGILGDGDGLGGLVEGLLGDGTGTGLGGSLDLELALGGQGGMFGSSGPSSVKPYQMSVHNTQFSPLDLAFLGLGTIR